jgi:hypothetical protein
LIRDYEAIDSCSTLDFKATDSFEARDFEITGSCSTLNLELIDSFKHEILKKHITL